MADCFKPNAPWFCLKFSGYKYAVAAHTCAHIHTTWSSVLRFILNSPVLSQLLSRILWYKRFLSLFSRFLYFFIYKESFESREKHPQSFLVQGVFPDLLNGWYLPQWVLEWVWGVMHAAHMLNSCNRRMTKLGWKCFLSNSKTENYLFFFFPFLGKWMETINLLMIQ